MIKTENSPALEYKLHRKFLPMRLNKKNFHKEFFRVDLKDIRAEVEKLAQGMDLSDPPQWRETEAGRVAEWQESRNIEQDPVAREKWLKRERRLARLRERNPLPQENGEMNKVNLSEERPYRKVWCQLTNIRTYRTRPGAACYFPARRYRGSGRRAAAGLKLMPRIP